MIHSHFQLLFFLLFFWQFFIIPSLKLTARTWKLVVFHTYSLPFGAFRPIFRGTQNEKKTGKPITKAILLGSSGSQCFRIFRYYRPPAEKPEYWSNWETSSCSTTALSVFRSPPVEEKILEPQRCRSSKRFFFKMGFFKKLRTWSCILPTVF